MIINFYFSVLCNNICCVTELRLLLVFWLLVVLTWLWAGLHMAYQLIGLLVIYCIFNVSLVRIVKSATGPTLDSNDSRTVCRYFGNYSGGIV